MRRSILARPSAAFVRRAPRAFSTSTHKADTHATSRIQSIQESFYETVDRVDVHVPATTANMGPGFDSLGLAMNVYNRLVVTRADKFSMTIEGEGADRIKPSPDNLIVKCVEKGLAAVGQPMVPLHFECQNSVPPTRGMGSSSAALVSGLAAGLALGGKDLSTPATKKLLLQLAADEEGHPDNVAPAIYGGFQVAFRTACPGQWVTQRVNIPTGLQCVLFIPDDEMKTSEARGCLPENLTCAARNSGAILRAQFGSAQFADGRLLTPLRYADAVHNISRAAMLVNCFATSQFDPLRYAMEDKLHQPHRKHMFPYYPIIEASLEAGAPRTTTARTHASLPAARRSSLTASTRLPPQARTARSSRAPAPPSSRSPAASAPRASAPTRCRSSSPRRSRRR